MDFFLDNIKYLGTKDFRLTEIGIAVSFGLLHYLLICFLGNIIIYRFILRPVI